MNFGKMFALKSKETASNSMNGTAPTHEISYKIAHAIPGRIRFHIPQLAIDPEYATKLKALIESDSRITDVRFNQKAASFVVNYQPDAISDDQVRSHLVNLIQTAPNIAEPKPATARSIVRAIFDAVVNLIDSVRNINNARKGIVHGQQKTDTWERVLSSVKSTTKKLESAIMFVLPKRSPKLDGESPLPTDKE